LDLRIVAGPEIEFNSSPNWGRVIKLEADLRLWDRCGSNCEIIGCEVVQWEVLYTWVSY